MSEYMWELRKKDSKGSSGAGKKPSGAHRPTPTAGNVFSVPFQSVHDSPPTPAPLIVFPKPEGNRKGHGSTESEPNGST